MHLKFLHRSSLAVTLISSAACSVSSGSHRLDVAPTLAPHTAGISVNVIADSAAAPRGDQIITGWMGSVLGGFIAWQLVDDPHGEHSKVINGWRYTPRALTALAIGSHVGTTVGVWARGRNIGSRGSVLYTALGAALPTIPVLRRTDDPLLMLKVVAFWAPLQGYLGYTGYRVGTRAAARAPDPLVAARDASQPRRSNSVILRDELRRTAYTNAFDAVNQLRQNWLSAARQRSANDGESGASGVIVVYLDGGRIGLLEALRQVALIDVDFIEYLDARMATTRYGTGHPAGAIMVRRLVGGNP